MDLREKREYLKLTKQQLAEKLGVHVNTISNVESGESSNALVVSCNRLLNELIVFKHKREFKDKIKKIKSNKLILEWDDTSGIISVDSRFKYFTVHYNYIACRFIISSVSTTIESWDDINSEIEEVKSAVDLLNQ